MTLPTGLAPEWSGSDRPVQCHICIPAINEAAHASLKQGTPFTTLELHTVMVYLPSSVIPSVEMELQSIQLV